MYVVGQTGTGKSTFLKIMALQDMLNGDGFAFIDPHGDVAERLLAMVPRERTEDVIYFCPADMDYPLGLNLFEFQSPDQKDFLSKKPLICSTSFMTHNTKVLWALGTNTF